MFLEQVCYWGPKGDMKTKTIPRKLEKGTGQTGHHESVPMLEQGSQKGPPLQDCTVPWEPPLQNY